MSFKYTANNLRKLEHLYAEARYTIRYEKGHFNSGYCILEHRQVVVINRFLSLEGRINALLEILPSLSICLTELSPDGLRFYGQCVEHTVVSESVTEKTLQTQMDL